MIPDFSQKDIDILARRSALRCSNPDCDKLTNGPNVEAAKYTNIGEAAHIYGKRPDAARYRKEMSDQERGTISNGIWLCRDCHGLIDKDPQRFPPTLLLAWKDTHETKIVRELGKPGERIRLEIETQEMEAFKKIPPFARQIIKDKPDYWEFMLTAELLEHYLHPVMQRASDLQRGLYAKPLVIVPPEMVVTWLSAKTNELTDSISALTNLFAAITECWGEPGVTGDADKIVHCCDLFGRCAERFVALADEATFTKVPDGFEGIERSIAGAALHPVKKFPELYTFIRGIFAGPKPTGNHVYNMVLELPEGWSDEIQMYLKKGAASLKGRSRW